MVGDLVEKSESHVIIFLLLRLLLFLLLLSGRSSTTSRSGSSSRGSSGSSTNGGKLLASFSDQSGKILTLQVLEDKVKVGLVSLDSNGSKDLLDVGGVGILASLLEQKCCSKKILTLQVLEDK